MSIAPTVMHALRFKGVKFDVVKHPHTATAAGSAHAAHVHEDHFAKAVLLKDHGGFILAVLPANELVDLERVSHVLHRPLSLASESDLEEAFYDCELGAIPAVGEDYLIPTIVDERLRHLKEVFFEAGDHERLVHISSDGFSRLMEDAEFLSSISVPHR
jgi:Ala-tRNA(Pro) deacylase